MSERGNTFLRAVDKYAGIPLTAATALYRKLAPPYRMESGGRSRTGIICLGAIGDLLLVSALANGLKTKMPETRVEIIASSANAQALPLIADIDDARAFPISKPHKMLDHIRAGGYDYLFDSSQWARLGNLLCALSGAGQTIGFATRGQWRSLGYDLLARHRSDCHELENFLALGRAVWPDFTGAPRLKIPDNHALERFGNPEKAIFFHLWPAPGKGRALKEWPARLWAGLGRKLLASGFKIFLTGSPGEARATQDFIAAWFRDADNIYSLAGKTTLAELAALLKRGVALVSVNTGIMHLGALLDVPVVGLHGATNPRRWGPVGKNSMALLPRKGECAYLDLGFEYPRSALNSLENLPVEDVLGALREINVL